MAVQLKEVSDLVQGALSSNGHPLTATPGQTGELRDSTALLGDAAALQERMAADGYLLLRRFFPREAIIDGRRELCEKLSTAGLIDRRYPLTEAIFSGDTSQAEAMDRWAFARYLRTGEA